MSLEMLFLNIFYWNHRHIYDLFHCIEQTQIEKKHCSALVLLIICRLNMVFELFGIL